MSTDSKEEKQSRKEKKAKKEKQKKAEKTHALYEKLIGIVGPSRVSTDRLERLLYSHDLASLPKEIEMGFKMVPDAVVRPRSAAEVSELFKLAIEEGISVVPRGGGSWGLGGAVPIEGGIVLDLTNMNRILRVDPENMEVEVEAGATWEKVCDEPNKVEYRFTRCMWAEAFRELDADDIGSWICEGDDPGVHAYHPRLRCRMTKTLMKGDPYCDHCFYVQEGEGMGEHTVPE